MHLGAKETEKEFSEPLRKVGCGEETVREDEGTVYIYVCEDGGTHQQFE